MKSLIAERSSWAASIARGLPLYLITITRHVSEVTTVPEIMKTIAIVMIQYLCPLTGIC